MAYISLENVGKTYQMGEVSINALHNASFEVEKGELVVIVGPSGAGKTTLLNILGGMDTLTEGKVTLDGKEISSLNRRQLTQYRRLNVGFVRRKLRDCGLKMYTQTTSTLKRLLL